MEDSKVFVALEDLLEMESGAIRGEEQLCDLPGWDSITMVGFLAMAFETFGAAVAPNRLMECRTMTDLARLVADGRQGGAAE